MLAINISNLTIGIPPIKSASVTTCHLSRLLRLLPASRAPLAPVGRGRRLPLRAVAADVVVEAAMAPVEAIVISHVIPLNIGASVNCIHQSSNSSADCHL
jgi:hypothetical protein